MQSDAENVIRELTIKCPRCGVRFPADRGATRREVEGRPSIIDIGVSCPMCEDWTHSYYTTEELEAMRAGMTKLSRSPMSADQKTLALSKARKAIQRKHDELQRAMRNR